MVYAKERLHGDSVVDTEGDVRHVADFQGATNEWLDVPEIEWPTRKRPVIAPAYDYEAGETPHRDYGGNISELTPESEMALYNAGLGNREMRARVETLLKARQSRINKAGIEAVRKAGVAADAARDIDITSPEYLAKHRLDADRRNRRA